MSNQEINETDGKPTRRQFVLKLGIVAASVTAVSSAGFALLKHANIFKTTKASNSKTVKLLTRDGQLVEVETAHIAGSHKKVTDTDLQQWIKRN